jgi:hypothetical protein
MDKLQIIKGLTAYSVFANFQEVSNFAQTSEEKENHPMTNSQIPEMLKQAAFDLYLSIHKPAGMDLDACANYDHDTDSGCIDQPDVIPCRSCAAYVRLVDEFEALPVG